MATSGGPLRQSFRTIIGAIFSFAFSETSAQTTISSEWNAGSGNWNVPGNWSPVDVPDDTDTVFYNVQIGNRAVAANALVEFIPEDGPNDIVSSLALSNGVDLNVGSNLLVVNGTTTLTGSGTRLFILGNSGQFSFSTDQLILNTGTAVFTRGMVDVDVRLTINSGSLFGGRGSAFLGDPDGVAEIALDNSGRVFVDDPSGLTLQTNGVDTLDLDGTSETGIVDVFDTILSAGTLELKLVVDGPLSDAFSGTLRVGAGDTVTFNDNFTMDGALVQLNGGSFTATINGPGNITSIANSTFEIEEDVVFANTITFTGTGNTINLTKASLSVPGLVVHGALNVLAAGGQESSITLTGTNPFLIFGADSSITLNSNLLLVSPSTTIQTATTFSGSGTLRIAAPPAATSEGSRMAALHGANINVALVNEGVYFVTGAGSVGRNDVKAFQQTATGHIYFDIGNFGDVLVVNGPVQLAGRLEVNRTNISIAAGQTFDIISTSAGITGQFDTFVQTGVSGSLKFEVSYTSNTVRLTVVQVQPSPTPSASPTATATATPTATPTGTPPSPTLLGNISTRLKVETGDNVLIGGFIITGTQDKKVILRGIGPSTGVPGSLADPQLELFSGNTLLRANDNWMDAPNRQEIIDSTIAPANDLESAILMTLPANNSAYTAVLRGAQNGTGIGLVEAYDLDQSVDSRLANISTRGFVQQNDNVMIAGFFVLNGTQKVIVRAIGPSLPIPGKLENPTLQLFDGQGTLVESNDNWRTDNEAAIIATTIPPTNDLESAIVRTLPPNAYTAIARGVNNSIGIAVIEVYALN